MITCQFSRNCGELNHVLVRSLKDFFVPRDIVRRNLFALSREELSDKWVTPAGTI